MRKKFVKNPAECKALWNALISHRNVSDLWDFRACFQTRYASEPYFMILEDRKGIVGMAPLCYSRELERLIFYPGETWQDKTWLERTPLYLRDTRYLPDLLFACPEPTYLRYMDLPLAGADAGVSVDEIGYVLYPPAIHFDPSLFAGRFSTKKYKAIVKTIHAITGKDTTFHVNRIEDFDLLVDMNISRFGEYSYLSDPRFREGFRDVMFYLLHRDLLRMVSLEIDGKTRAVDLGAIFRGVYTVFIGGTDPDIPGVAKVINMHHITYACSTGLKKVDFLCGEFHWKQLWHLDPEPLYKFISPDLALEEVGRPSLQDESAGYLLPGEVHAG